MAQGALFVVEQEDPEPPGEQIGGMLVERSPHLHAASEGAPQPHWQAICAIPAVPTTERIASTGPTRVSIAMAM